MKFNHHYNFHEADIPNTYIQRIIVDDNHHCEIAENIRNWKLDYRFIFKI